MWRSVYPCDYPATAASADSIPQRVLNGLKMSLLFTNFRGEIKMNNAKIKTTSQQHKQYTREEIGGAHMSVVFLYVLGVLEVLECLRWSLMVLDRSWGSCIVRKAMLSKESKIKVN